MKLVVGIVHRDDASDVIEALIREGYRTTRLSSTGGFLREGNSTILCGVKADKVPKVLEIIKANTQERRQRAPALLRFLSSRSGEVVISAATVFVLDLQTIERF